MKPNYRWLIVILCIVCLPLAACGSAAPAADEAPKPLTIQRFENAAEPTLEKLTQEAATRLDIQTTPVRVEEVNGSKRSIIPYAAILYDTQGNTWAYINREPLTYLRRQVNVDNIQGDDAILTSDDLAHGIQVVTRGAEELYGAEFEFQEE